MRIAMFIVALAICGFANDCFAGEQRRGVEFKVVSPCDVLYGTGVFIKDTGKNIVGGVRTTAKGLGELITAPFRAKILIPKKRTFHYVPPRLQYEPGELRELKPPVITLPPKLEQRDYDDIIPLRFLPAPAGINKNVA